MSSTAKSRPPPKRSTPSPAAASSNGSRPAATNAWSRPLQPKPGPPPGMGGPGASTSTASNHKTTANKTPPVLRERFLHLSLSLVGQKVVVTRTNGSQLEGILHTFTPFSSQPKERRNVYVLKACKSLTSSSGEEEIPPGKTVLLSTDQVSSLVVKSMRLDTITNGTVTPQTSTHGSDAFRTDTEISSLEHSSHRPLVMAGSAWTSAANNSKTGKTRAEGLLEDGKGSGGRVKGGNSSTGGALKGAIGSWDQFKANEDLFQVKANFDENLYTTSLDKAQLDSQKVKEAERLAREIESTVSTNMHLQEERGQAVEGDFDEEDRYSGVLPNKKEAAKSKTKPEKPKTMNYAAAASKNASPPVKAAAGPAESKPGDKEKKTPTPPAASEAATEKAVENKTEESKATPEQKDETTTAEKKDETKEPKKEPTKKLNANAKSFTFNPGAKSFVPPAPAAPPPEAVIDPNTGLPMGQPPVMQAQYMHPGMGQPGMMPMMNTPYMRYQGAPYPGVEQHHMGMPPPQQPQHMPPPSQPAPPPPDGSQSSGDEPPPQPDGGGAQAPPPQQQQGMAMPYGPPGGTYYNPGMMGRGPGGAPMYPQAPQQMQYRQMYPMQAGPPPPQMRGTPYYNPAGMHYPPGGGGYNNPGGGRMMEEDYRSGRGGRGGRGRGRRNNSYKGGGRGGGGGRGSYYNNSGGGGGSGRQTPQSASGTDDGRDTPSAAPGDAPPAAGEETKQAEE